jgi:hypothetical protein
MTVTVSPKERDRLLRELTGRHLAEPDPAKWLAAADLYAEGCDRGRTCACKGTKQWVTPQAYAWYEKCAELAALWRARGRFFTGILAAYHRCVERDAFAATNATNHAAVVRFQIVWHRDGRRVCVEVEDARRPGPDSDRVVAKYRWAYEWPDRHYLTRRALQLIDAHRDLLCAGEGRT